MSEFSILIAVRNDFSLFLDQADASFTVLYETDRITSKTLVNLPMPIIYIDSVRTIFYYPSWISFTPLSHCRCMW